MSGANITLAQHIILEMLAKAKQLPAEFLRELGVENHQRGVTINYFDQDHKPHPRIRLRTALAHAKYAFIWLGPESVSPIAYGVWRLKQARDKGFLVLVEGESDSWTLWHHDYPALGIPGATMVKMLLNEYLLDIQQIFIYRELGQGGDTFVTKLTEHLSELHYPGEAYEFSIPGVKDPSEPHCDDHERFKARLDEAMNHAAALNMNVKSAQSHAELPSQDGRPIIPVNGMHLRNQVKLALDAMQTRNEPPALFERGREIMRREPATGNLETLDSKGLLAEAAEAVNWVKEARSGDTIPDAPPANVISAILGARRLPFPPIEGVARAPFFTREGKLVIQLGYHADARVYLALDGMLASQLSAQSYPEHPTAEEVAGAVALLDELFCDFPLVDAASYAHTIELTLLPFVRLMIDGPTPNHAVNAPMRGEGTGKGLLIKAACAPALGRVAASPETREAEEMRKVLLAAVMEAAPIVWFDNQAGEIKSGPLAAVLTSDDWVDRILGKSKRFRGRVLTTWCIAGNNLRFSREQRRRAVLIELNANVPRAWTRTGFKHELPRWAMENRASLIRACVILVNNWIAHGRPAGSRTLGSYEDWSRVIGGILESAGIEGFLENSDEHQDDTDREAQRWNTFVEAWWNTYAAKPVTAKDLLELAGEIIPDDGKSERSHVTRLGSLLMSYVNATFEVASYKDGYLKIVRAEVGRTSGGANNGYALMPLPSPAKTPDEVSKVSRHAENAANPAKLKENFSANLAPNRATDFNEVSGAKRLIVKENLDAANLANLGEGFPPPGENNLHHHADEAMAGAIRAANAGQPPKAGDDDEGEPV
jgi:hypothetical protein